MLLLIDNYDSFTYNLVHAFGMLDAKVEVVRNDALTVDEAMGKNPSAIIVSPGPCDPSSAGICVDLIKRAAPEIPIFGVCLGHQSIGEAFGGNVVRASQIMHGKLSPVRHTNSSVFKDLPEGFEATRYHSLTVERDSLPDCLQITAETDDGTIMGLSHKQHPSHGVQFHPESIASEYGMTLMENFLKIAEVRR
jgi:anthranilate synthase component 2